MLELEVKDQPWQNSTRPQHQWLNSKAGVNSVDHWAIDLEL